MEDRGLQERRAFGELRELHRRVVGVQDLGALVAEDALRQPGGAARVHEDDRVRLLGLVREHRVVSRDQVLVADVVWSVRVVGAADQDGAADRALIAGQGHRLGEQGREGLVDERDFGARVAHDVVEFLAGQAQVERVDHARSQEGGVVQLDVLVAVQRHDREAVGAPDAQFAGQRRAEAHRTVGVFAEGRAVCPVDERFLVGQVVHRGNEEPVEDEFLHGAPFLGSVPQFADRAAITLRWVWLSRKRRLGLMRSTTSP